MRKLELNRVIAFLLMVSISVNFYLWFTKSVKERHYFSSEETNAIERSIQMKARKEHLPREKIEKLTSQVAISFLDEICVQISPAEGVVGGSTIVCFAKNNYSLTKQILISE